MHPLSLIWKSCLAVGGWDWVAKNNTNWDTLSAQWLHAPLAWAISVTHSVAVCNTINVCCKTKIDARSVPSPPPGTHGYWERPHSAEKFTVYYRREAAEALLRVAGHQGVCALSLSVNLKRRILDIRSMFVVEARIYELKSLKTKARRFKVKQEHRGFVYMHRMSTVQSKFCFIEKCMTT